MKLIHIIPLFLVCLISFAFTPYDEYYYPWLEFPSRRVSIHPDSLPPNQGTDELTILFNAVGPYENSMLGKHLCLAGDQNGDGYDDILAYCQDPHETRLYFGAPTGEMDTIPGLVFPLQQSSSPYAWSGVMPTELADLNGDGDVDIVVEWEDDFTSYREVYVYFGGALLDSVADLVLVCDNNSSSSSDGFGYSMSCGDVNGDNYDDLAVGAPNYRFNFMNGKIFIYFGGLELDSIPDFTITSGYNNFGGLFGHNVSISGDVNNNGYCDMTSIWDKASEIDSTGIHLFYGGVILDSIPDWTYQLLYAPGQYLVWSGNIIPDLNNDCFDEIVVSTMYGYGWQVHLFFGGETIGDEPDLIFPGGSEGPRKVKTAGDVNTDGYNDMIMGSHDDNWVKVYYGGDPMDIWADISFYLPDAGCDVSSAGDVNNDGIHDFMFYACDDAGLNAGQIFIYGDPDLTPHVEDRISEYQCNQCFKLNQNYPNPFNGATVIGFQAYKSGWVDLNIYNILGQTVYSSSHDCSSGEMVKILWDGRDMKGNVLPSGVYMVELTNGVERRVNKLQIIR